MIGCRSIRSNGKEVTAVRFYQIGHQEVPGTRLYSIEGTSTGVAVDPWRFFNGERVPDIPGLGLSVRNPGRQVDFGFTGSTPIVRRWVGEVLESLAPNSVQRISTTVRGELPGDDEVEVLNIVERRRCVDARRSNVWEWTERDKQRGRREGYKAIWELYVHASALEDVNLCRVGEYPVVAIAAEAVYDEMMRRETSGIRFRLCS